MDPLLVAILVWCVTGAAALVIGRAARLANCIGALGLASGCLVGLSTPIRVLLSSQPRVIADVAWSVPGGAFHVLIDPLAAWFLIPILFVGLWIVISTSVIAGQSRTLASRSGWMWCNMAALFSGMVIVVGAANVLLWLVAWEVMSLSLYFLVTLNADDKNALDAGWTYLVATHLATACLAPAVLLCGGTGELWTLQPASAALTPTVTGAAFVLAAIGFGAKAGLMPFHVWMPDTYSHAPSFVPALSSGLMSKVAIYGLVRSMLLLNNSPPLWWGLLLLALGLISGLGGLLFALPQRDVRRTLAYSSSENIGIIYLGLGIGVLGLHVGSPAAATLGFAGALLHVWNHALFKSLLFLATATVEHSTGTTRIDALGGLMKRMPVVGCCFGLGALAIAGVPPLNGFISEFLIFLSAFEEQVLSGRPGTALALGVIAGLALMGGLAVMCFTQVFGLMFLGEPRSDAPNKLTPPTPLMLLPLVVLAATCLLVALLAAPLVRQMTPILTMAGGNSPEAIANAVQKALEPLTRIRHVFMGVIAMIGLLTGVRFALLSGREVGTSGTWDCGYAAPSARMQYTAASYAQAIGEFLPRIIPGRTRLKAPEGLFPQTASLEADVIEPILSRGYRPLFVWGERGLRQLAFLQHGRTNLYVLYIALTLLVLLWWHSGRSL